MGDDEYRTKSGRVLTEAELEALAAEAEAGYETGPCEKCGEPGLEFRRRGGQKMILCTRHRPRMRRLPPLERGPR